VIWIVLVIVVVVLLVVFGVVGFNRLRTADVGAQEALGGIDVQLTRRADLIPNLVETVKGYLAHESAVLQRVTEARSAATAHQGDAPAQRRPFEEEVGGAVQGVFAVAESYPDLKASVNFLQLQKELTNTEDRIAAGRRFYNGNVRALNTRVQTFPSNLVASTFGFTGRDFFELSDPAAAQTPSVGL
jgi:LemA protein